MAPFTTVAALLLPFIPAVHPLPKDVPTVFDKDEYALPTTVADPFPVTHVPNF